MKNLNHSLASLAMLATLMTGCDETKSAPATPAKPAEPAAKKPPKVSLPAGLQATVAKADAKVDRRGEGKPIAFTIELPAAWKADDTGSKTRLKWVNGGANRDYLGRVDISSSTKQFADMGNIAIKRPGEVQSVAREEVVDGVKLKTDVGKANSNTIRMRARTVLDAGDDAVLICEAGIVRDEGLGDAKAAQDLVEGICLGIKLSKT